MKNLKKIKSLSVTKSNFFSKFKKPDGIRITKRTLRIVGCGVALAVLMASAAMPVFASGNVSGAIESTWNAAQSQIKQVASFLFNPSKAKILSTNVDGIFALYYSFLSIKSSVFSSTRQDFLTED